jgi:predicted Zn-dependent peptidase
MIKSRLLSAPVFLGTIAHFSNPVASRPAGFSLSGTALLRSPTSEAFMPATKRLIFLCALAVTLLVAALGAQAKSYLDLENQIQEFTLDNGVHFIVLEKHDVPVFSFRTYVNVGSANEIRGITGIAHILEHMAFKGTSEIGGTDLKKELKAMEAEDRAFEEFKRARLELVPRIEKLEHKYDRLVGGIPAERQEKFAEVAAKAHDLNNEIEINRSGKVTITHAPGMESEEVENFDMNGDEIAALDFYVDEIRPLEQEFAEKEQNFEDAKEAAREFVVTNEFGQIIEENGGMGLNASTSADVTRYHYSFPSNRLELWAYLEGSRMSDPVLREFYTEKDGPVTEERRMRTDNNPIGRIIEIFQNQMFMANGYHHSTIGYMSDINNISRADCQKFFEDHYHGGNMVVAIVGDVDFNDVKKYAKKYFGNVPAGKPSSVETFEPKQLVEKRMVMQDPSQPLYIAGYHIQSASHPDWPVYEVISDVLGQGRTSRLHKRLVKEDKLAVTRPASPAIPATSSRAECWSSPCPSRARRGTTSRASSTRKSRASSTRASPPPSWRL